MPKWIGLKIVTELSLSRPLNRGMLWGNGPANVFEKQFLGTASGSTLLSRDRHFKSCLFGSLISSAKVWDFLTLSSESGILASLWENEAQYKIGAKKAWSGLKSNFSKQFQFVIIVGDCCQMNSASYDNFWQLGCKAAPLFAHLFEYSLQLYMQYSLKCSLNSPPLIALSLKSYFKDFVKYSLKWKCFLMWSLQCT